MAAGGVDGLRVQFLGGFQILMDGQPVYGFDSFRLQSLFAYIVLHPQAPIPRRQIAFLLWPDSTEEQAMANLRFLLFSLRRALPEAGRYLEVGARTVQLRQDAVVSVDVGEFERVAANAQSLPDLKQTIQGYTGELLPGHYDEWVLAERDRLQQLLAQAIERLIGLCERARDYPTAIQAAQRLLQLDPLNENAYRRLMTLHALNRDKSAAVNIYHRCSETLMRELGVRPDPKTQEIYEMLLSVDGFPQPPDIASVIPLVGRTAEWQFLERAWNAAVAGRPHLVLLEGGAGIGKTRLAEEMLRWAGRQGIGSGAAHCYAAEGPLAFGPLTEWLRERPLQSVKDVWLVEASRLLPEIAVQRPDLPAPAPVQESWRTRSSAINGRCCSGSTTCIGATRIRPNGCAISCAFTPRPK
ncbi:MAG TPA: BTAD domain-containing putative transcriptional regulator [Anaerolinea sp.]|nr:BTAD domain-containing putative transcriptional regulator [Anaerolinea sp.]